MTYPRIYESDALRIFSNLEVEPPSLMGFQIVRWELSHQKCGPYRGGYEIAIEWRGAHNGQHYGGRSVGHIPPNTLEGYPTDHRFELVDRRHRFYEAVNTAKLTAFESFIRLVQPPIVGALR